jgi:hypothetical protein
MLFVVAVIQFGYASLFVVAFPLAPLLALINNYIEIRVDSFKVLFTSARAIPRGAQDIGKRGGASMSDAFKLHPSRVVLQAHGTGSWSSWDMRQCLPISAW